MSGDERTVEDARRLGMLEHVAELLAVLRDREAVSPGAVEELLVYGLHNAITGWCRVTGTVGEQG